MRRRQQRCSGNGPAQKRDLVRSNERAQARKLNALTTVFYDRVSASFSQTRSAPWQGWEELWALIGPALDERDQLSAIDVGCGNLRFARFLAQKREGAVRVHGIDACPALLAEGMRSCESAGASGLKVCGVRIDAVRSLLDGDDPLASAPASDLTVTFGFMHHLPTSGQRSTLLELMARHTRPGGFIAASFWRFGDDERLRTKAEAATVRARKVGAIGDLAENDYVLGWQDDEAALRFCHHFTEEEVDALSSSLSSAAEEVARFSADGKSGALNRYAVWRVHG